MKDKLSSNLSKREKKKIKEPESDFTAELEARALIRTLNY